ncbi:MAG: heavy metal-binding domain-containing protein [Chthoniobacterales bacterium]
MPTFTGKQQYSQTLMQIAGPPATRAETTNNTAEVDDLRFDLTLENDEPLRVGVALLLRGKVTTKDGRVFTQLEPVMGAFAHMVAFPTSLDSIAHIHPLGKEPEQASERGGPFLSFAFAPEKAGYYKVFLQTQVGGRNRFAAFGMKVEPALPGAAKASGEHVCPMHPEVKQEGPGVCPKCGMALMKK